MNAPLNTSDRKSIRAHEKAAAIADRERGEVLISIMSSTPGRRWVWDKMGAAHIFQTSFSVDAVQMAFNEGERNQGLLLLNDIMQWCPDQFILAMREANERRTWSPSPDRPTPGQLDRDEGHDGGDQESADDPDDGGALYDYIAATRG